MVQIVVGRVPGPWAGFAPHPHDYCAPDRASPLEEVTCPRAPGQNGRTPLLFVGGQEAQRGAASSIRKTAGVTFGTTYVT